MAEKTLGKILLEQGAISQEALDHALELQRRRLGEILIQENLVDPLQVDKALQVQAKSQPPGRAARITLNISDLEAHFSRLGQIEDELLRTGVQSERSRSLVSEARRFLEGLLLNPVDSLFDRAKLVVNQFVLNSDHRVNIECKGQGLVLDRTVIDDLSDIALHLVRNALAHGIEPAKERAKVGKSETGHIQLEILRRGNALELTVFDDGRGVNLEKVYEKAVSKKLIEGPRSQWSDDQVLRLIFEPGLSTAESSSSVSGRGVGLDAVASAARRLGGSVVARPLSTSGMIFSVFLPLPNFMMTILPLKIGNSWVGVDLSEVQEVSAIGDERVRGLHSTGLLVETSDSNPLFGVTSAAKTEPQMRIRFYNNAVLSFADIGNPEKVLVREAGAIGKLNKFIIGSARLESGVSVAIFDSSQIEASPEL